MGSSNLFGNELANEISQAELGDKRLSKRAGQITSHLIRDPSATFAKVFSSEAHLEAFYRFLRNPNVVWKDLLEAHFVASARRAHQEEEVLVIHDTTTFEFGSGAEREDLGWVSYKNKQSAFKSQGFFGHFALAARATGDRAPIGVVGFAPYRRIVPPRKLRKKQGPDKESTRWGQMVKATEEKLSRKTTSIHVMDREADSYELLSQMFEDGCHFVIRLCYDRRVKDQDSYFISDALKHKPWVCSREVKLSTRKLPKGTACRKKHPARKSRLAKLGFKAAPVQIKRPDKVHWINKSLELNVVQVFEIDTPEGVDPVEWKIITSEPIDTEEEILRIVDIYRARWLIEDYFKALKAGCKYEERQLESYKTLLSALVLLIPVAWQLLLMRHLSRATEDAPAEHYFSQSEMTILRKRSDYKMSLAPTLKDALWAVASLGGHIRNNGDPGWLVLMRGFQDLLKIDIGYQLAQERCDQ